MPSPHPLEVCFPRRQVVFTLSHTLLRPSVHLSHPRVLMLVIAHSCLPRNLTQTSLDTICAHPALAATGWANDLPRLLAHFQNLARQREEVRKWSGSFYAFRSWLSLLCLGDGRRQSCSPELCNFYFALLVLSETTSKARYRRRHRYRCAWSTLSLRRR